MGYTFAVRKEATEDLDEDLRDGRNDDADQKDFALLSAWVFAPDEREYEQLMGWIADVQAEAGGTAGRTGCTGLSG